MAGNQNGGDSQDWDWEVLVDDSQIHHLPNPNPSPNLEIEEEVEQGGEEEGYGSVIRSDYFSLEFDSHVQIEANSDLGNMDLDDDKPKSESGSWIDPGQVQFPTSKNFRGKSRKRDYRSSSSQSDSDYSPTRGQSSDNTGSDSSHDLMFFLKPHSDCTSDHQLQVGLTPKIDVGIEIEQSAGTPFHVSIEEQQEEEGKEHECGDSGDFNLEKEENVNMNMNMKDDDGGNNGEVTAKHVEDEEKATITNNNGYTKGCWWRVPMELLKYCVLRVKPVWSLSVAAAAIMGFVLLRRSWLYKVKRKTQQGLRPNVTVDDKKVSQFMTRAARLNEAFSVVKRVPIIRPSLPAPGLAPWPVISMR